MLFVVFFMQLPLEVTLDASNSTDVEGIVSLSWDCEGDGVFEATSDWSVATARTHVCTYAEDGAFEATVQATNSLVRTIESCICCFHVLFSCVFLTWCFHVLFSLPGIDGINSQYRFAVAPVLNPI